MSSAAIAVRVYNLRMALRVLTALATLIFVLIGAAYTADISDLRFKGRCRNADWYRVK
jgi:hypothetical protein